MEIQYRKNKGEIFATLKNEWVKTTSEEEIRQKFICQLVNDYGYSLHQLEQDFHIANDSTDIVIWKNQEEKKQKKSPTIIIICQTSAQFKNQDYLQVENYALIAKADFFVIVGKQEVKTFRLSEEKPPLQLEELEDFPNADVLNDENKISSLLKKLKSVSKDAFKRVFFNCHDAIRNNDKFSPEMAFDEFAKVLFIKTRYEKENKTIFNRDVFLSLDKPYQQLFDDIKEKYKDDGIFGERDILRIRELTFLQILDKLKDYNLAEIPEDTKGVAFEEFLGKTFRGDLGQFFTPRPIVNFMTEILDPQEGEFVCDPCCGSGGFLIKSFEHIKTTIKNDIRNQKKELRKNYREDNLTIDEQNELIQQFKKLEKDLDNNLLNSRLHKLSNNCIFGTDAEPRSARTAKMNMIMQGDGHSGVHHHDGLLNVNGIFENRFDVILTNPPFGARVSQDYILKQEDITPLEADFSKYQEKYGEPYTNAQEATIKRFNSLKKENKNIKGEGVRMLDLFDVGEYSSLTEVLFIERCLNLLKKGGRMGIVLPEGFLNGSDLQKVRDLIEGKAKLLFVVSAPQDVFISAGASVKSSLVFLKKFTDLEEIEYQRIEKEAKKEIFDKYQTEIEEKEAQHKKIWHQIQNKRAYIKDVKSIKAAKSEKDMQISWTNSEINQLQQKHKEDKKEFDSWHKDLEKKMLTEVKAAIKSRFDYEFVVSEVKQAGISSTGQEIQNDLLSVKEEFERYRELHNLWVYGTLGIVTKIHIEANRESGFLKQVSHKDTTQWDYEFIIKATENIKSLKFPVTKISELCQIGSGGTPSRLQNNYYGGTIPWVKTGEVKEQIIFETEEKITELGLKDSGAKMYKAGSLIIAMYGATAARTAKLGIDASTNQACAVLYDIDNSKINTDFLWLYLQNQQSNIKKLSAGSAQFKLNAQNIANYLVPLPPLSLQNEIVEYINIQKEKIKHLQQTAEDLRKTAKEDFEKEIFN